jgi:hypothetical protein
MPKIALCISLLFNTFNFIEDREIGIKNIEYNIENYNIEFINLKIDLFSKKEDIVEINIAFYNAEKTKLNENFHSSALTIKGDKSTIARIPFKLEEKIYLDISFYSNNFDEIFDRVMFPVYPKINGICYLHESFSCKGETPSVVQYKDKKISEKYDKISLLNKNLSFFSFKNKMPLENIKIASALKIQGGYGNLLIEKKINEFEINYDDGYAFPLIFERINGVIELGFANQYYLDLIRGKTYEDYQMDTIKINQIIFPYVDESYDIEIELINCFASFERVVIDFSVITNKSLYGNCNASKYCLRRIY